MYCITDSRWPYRNLLFNVIIHICDLWSGECTQSIRAVYDKLALEDWDVDTWAWQNDWTWQADCDLSVCQNASVSADLPETHSAMWRTIKCSAECASQARHTSRGVINLSPATYTLTTEYILIMNWSSRRHCQLNKLVYFVIPYG